GSLGRSAKPPRQDQHRAPLLHRAFPAGAIDHTAALRKRQSYNPCTYLAAVHGSACGTKETLHGLAAFWSAAGGYSGRDRLRPQAGAQCTAPGYPTHEPFTLALWLMMGQRYEATQILNMGRGE